jgi:hypothetical protein
MKIAYVIGPYRASTIYGIRKNIIAAEQIGAEMAQAGVFPYVPHKNTAFFDGVADDSLWLEGNLEIIRRGIADFAVVVPGWAESSGSRGEIKLCHELGIPVLFREGPAFWVQLERVVAA